MYATHDSNLNHDIGKCLKLCNRWQLRVKAMVIALAARTLVYLAEHSHHWSLQSLYHASQEFLEHLRFMIY